MSHLKFHTKLRLNSDVEREEKDKRMAEGKYLIHESLSALSYQQFYGQITGVCVFAAYLQENAIR